MSGQLDPGFARYIGTIMHQPVDRVPFVGPQSHDHCMIVAQVPARKYYWDAELFVDVNVAVQRWYGFDTYLVLHDAYNLEVEALGGKMVYSDNAMPTVDTSHPLIKTGGDLDKIGSLDPSKGRLPFGVEIARLSFEKNPHLESEGYFCSTFSFLCQAMGYPKILRAIRRDKAFARELFDYTENEVNFPLLKAFSNSGVKNVLGPDAWSAFPNLTPDLIEEWVLPSAQRLAARGIEELGINVAPASAAADYCEEDPDKFDKNIMFRCWETALKFNPALILCYMGPTHLWNMKWLQEFALTHGSDGQKLVCYLSINGRFIRNSSPQKIITLIRKWVDILARDGSLILTIGNVPADTLPINIHTAVKAVRELTKYPIISDLGAIQISAPVHQSFDDWLKGQPEEKTILKARE
ncbi:MAG: hypothetical protein JXA42_22855 [Anaerolineales bacterium]|nr:hypothetical protein [Anaerolineales bacterium]